MNVGGTPRRTLWLGEDGHSVEIIDQTRLPHAFETVSLRGLEDAERAIRDMLVRGAPLIGVTAAYGVCLGLREDPSDAGLERACARLLATRPTAVNLRWALEEMQTLLGPVAPEARVDRAYARASEIAEEDVALCRAIGEHGAKLLADLPRRGDRPLQVLTHCNAGWLAAIDWGTALAPLYVAHEQGLPLEVWVDETRPRNQGASLTAWELAEHGISHRVVADNAGGHLMRTGQVDVCITGSDRTTADGDVCNKIGTYLKALAAHDNGIPFYVALPYSTIDWTLGDGAAIEIEDRGEAEVRWISGRDADGRIVAVDLLPAESGAANPAFDVTPARLVTRLITERGACEASRAGLEGLYPERVRA
ncbi:MAG: S-methyl-5-thioribose-1-phosphate isomerase [Myxococcota bacterium]